MTRFNWFNQAPHILAITGQVKFYLVLRSLHRGKNQLRQNHFPQVRLHKVPKILVGFLNLTHLNCHYRRRHTLHVGRRRKSPRHIADAASISYLSEGLRRDEAAFSHHQPSLDEIFKILGSKGVSQDVLREAAKELV